MLVKKDNYKKKIAPFSFDYLKSVVIPINVSVSFAVMDILSIAETDLVYNLKYRFIMRWYDYRLKYHNLKIETAANSFTSEEVNQLWIPYVIFANTENSEYTKGESESVVTVTREGDFKESSVDVTEEINIFEGQKNIITFQQTYSKTFKCVYQLQLYPFDTQVDQTHLFDIKNIFNGRLAIQGTLD